MFGHLETGKGKYEIWNQLYISFTSLVTNIWPTALSNASSYCQMVAISLDIGF